MHRAHAAIGPLAIAGDPVVMTKAVKKPILDRVEDLLIEHISPAKVSRIGARQMGKSPRTIRRYIGDVYKRWEQESPIDRPQRRSELSDELDFMLQIAIGVEPLVVTQMLKKTDSDGNESVEPVQFNMHTTDINAAVKVAALMAKLHGLDAPTQLEHSGSVATKLDLSSISDEDASTIREVIARARSASE